MPRKAEYTDRPLTIEEREFAAEHHGLIYRYMKNMKLDPEEWYDLLIVDYLQSVKRYFSNPQLQVYGFVPILFRRLDAARQAHFKAINAQKRMPEGGLCSLDYVVEESNGREHRVESWFIDHRQNIERQVIFSELFQEFYKRCIECEVDADGWCAWEGGINEYLKCELDLLIEDYTIKQINRKTEKQYPYGYKVDSVESDIEGFRRIFKEVFGI